MFMLRFPFRAVDEFHNMADPIALAVPHVQATLAFEDPYAVIKLSGYESEEAAANALPLVWNALMRASVISGWGVRVEDTLDHMVPCEDPFLAARSLSKIRGTEPQAPIYGSVNGNMPVVVPSHEQIAVFTAGDVTILSGVDGVRFAPFLEAALRDQGAPNAYTDDRLRLALELWCEHHCERAMRSKFLILVMALEVLTPPAAKHAVAQALLQRWLRELNVEMQRWPLGTDEREALESLGRELAFRADKSIRSRIRSNVLNCVGAASASAALPASRLAVQAYDLRSALLHNGDLGLAQLGDAHRAALASVRTLLLARLGDGHRIDGVHLQQLSEDIASRQRQGRDA